MPGKTVEVSFEKPDPKRPDKIYVIYFPTPIEVVDAMCKLGKIGKDDVVYDIGCGDGRLVIQAVKKFGAKKAVGIDISAERIAECKANAKKAGVDDKVTFLEKDALTIKDFSEATVVLTYLSDPLNEALRPTLQKTMKPGSRVVSHRFLMGDWKPKEIEDDRGEEQLRQQDRLRPAPVDDREEVVFGGEGGEVGEPHPPGRAMSPAGGRRIACLSGTASHRSPPRSTGVAAPRPPGFFGNFHPVTDSLLHDGSGLPRMSDSGRTLHFWLDRLRNGDPAAREGLIRHSRKRFRLLTRQMLRGFSGLRQWEETSDVLQNVLIRLDRALESIDVPTPLDFIKLATFHIRNELIDLRRHHYGAFGRGTHLLPPGLNADAFPVAADQSDEPRRLAWWTAFHEYIAALPEDVRQLFEVIYYQGSTREEAAILLGIPLRTLERLWLRAKIDIKEQLGDEWPF